MTQGRAHMVEMRNGYKLIPRWDDIKVDLKGYVWFNIGCRLFRY
jgi:hypothetical protein